MIKSVYFDLGGTVIRDFNGTNKWEEFEDEIQIPQAKRAEFSQFWDESESEISVGRDVEKYRTEIENQFGGKVPENYSILMDGFVKRFEKNKSIWPIITEVQKTCQIGLLTNMYPGMFNGIREHGLLPGVTWDIIIDSSIVHLQKPDPKIYKLAQEKAGVKGEEIFFIDNTLKNVEAAKRMGWQTFHYDHNDPKKSSRELRTHWRTLI